jgi:cell division protein FtsW
MRKSVKLAPPDPWLLGTVIVLVTVGVLLVFDASYAKAADTKTMNFDPWYLVKRQVVFAIFGVACMAVAARVSFGFFKKVTIPAVTVAFALLAAVLVIGHKAHGATSWFKLGEYFLQPSELAKIGMLLYLALRLSHPRAFAKNAPKRWVIPALMCLAMIGIVVMEKDLGTAALLAGVCAVMFYAAGAKKRSLALAALTFAVLALGACTQLSHVRARINAYQHPWETRYDEGYQTVHSLAGLGTGGLLGVGLCEGREKFYMPAASTDYILSTLGEETGLIGGIVLLAAFTIFTYRGLDIARRSKSSYGKLLAVGVTSLISVQALINVAVVSASIPATGLPLPFISYGGSGMVAMLVCVGILLSASRQVGAGKEEREPDESSSYRGRHRRAHISGHKRGSGASRGGSERRAAVRR